jgi:hypothetical protein
MILLPIDLLAVRADRRPKVTGERRLFLSFADRKSKSKSGFESSPRKFRPQGQRTTAITLIGNPR